MDIAAALLFISGCGFNALMDTVSFRWDKSIFKNYHAAHFFGPSKVTWIRKYTVTGNFQDPPKNWYYRTFDIAYKERFPLSATCLVFLTDLWHFAQWMMYNCFALAPALLMDNTIVWFLVMRICGGLLFTFLYNQGLEK